MSNLLTLMADFSELGDSVAPEVYFYLGPIAVNETLRNSLIVIAFIILLAAIVRIFVIPRFKFVPRGFQCFLEWIVSTFDTMASNMTGKLGKFLGPYTFGAAAFICFGVLLELFGLRSPIADLNTCVSLSMMTFILINFFGIQKHVPIGRIKYYFKPSVIVGPFRIISDLMVPVSMALRLFGSVLSGLITMELVYLVLPIWLSFGIPAVLSVVFTLFHAFIQAYVFAILTLTFIQEATE